jgi:quercetin dioxygenase-like cupin family protein
VKIHLQNLERVIPSPVARFWRTAARDLLLGSRRFTLFAITIGLAALFSASAQAQEAVPLAHGNVPGEPHHHLKIENEYVRAYYVEVPPHESTQLHQHDHDYIYVSLGPSDVVNAPLNKPEVHLQLKDGETHFTRGGFAHVARNLSDAPFRNVTIELLKPQDELQNLCEKIVEGELGECHPTENRFLSGKPYFRSAEMAVSVWILKPKAEFTALQGPDHLLVAMDQAEIQVTFPDPHFGPRPARDPATKLGSGGMLWIQGNRIHTMRNLRAEPSSYMLVLFKDSGSEKKR